MSESRPALSSLAKEAKGHFTDDRPLWSCLAPRAARATRARSAESDSARCCMIQASPYTPARAVCPRAFMRGGKRACAAGYPKSKPRPWREFPCFHADLPGFGFFLCVCCAGFFSPAWAKVFCLGPFLTRKLIVCFSAKNGVVRRYLRSLRGLLGEIYHSRLEKIGIPAMAPAVES